MPFQSVFERNEKKTASFRFLTSGFSTIIVTLTYILKLCWIVFWNKTPDSAAIICQFRCFKMQDRVEPDHHYWKFSEELGSSKYSTRRALNNLSFKDRVFANGTVDRGSIQGWVIPKTLKMILDTAFLNTQHYKERIRDKVEQPRERSSALPYTSV